MGDNCIGGINPKYHTLGGKIRNIRRLKGISAKEIGSAIGVNDTAIRNYELGFRTPKKEKVNGIAEILSVNPCALYERNLYSGLDFLHILFEIEEDFHISPYQVKDSIYLQVKDNDVFNSALLSWLNQREKFLKGEITKEEYDIWKYSYGNTHGENN